MADRNKVVGSRLKEGRFIALIYIYNITNYDHVISNIYSGFTVSSVIN